MLAASVAVEEMAVGVPLMMVGTSIMVVAEVVVGAFVVVGRGVKKLGVTGTTTPTPVTVMATGAFVVCVDRVVGVTGSDEKVNAASAVVDVAPGVFVRDSTKGNTCVPLVGLESVVASVLELAETSVVREEFPVLTTIDPLRFEEMAV